jgi:hypothetical protein
MFLRRIKDSALAFAFGSPKANRSGKDFCYLVLFEIRADTGCVAGGKNFCFRVLRAPFVLACKVCLFALANKQTCDFGLPKSVFYQNSSAKAESARFRANMSEAAAQRRLRARIGRPRRESPGFLSWPLLCGTTKKWHHTRSAQREAVCASVEVLVKKSHSLFHAQSCVHVRVGIQQKFTHITQKLINFP